jgi:hypothetical protein
MKVTIEEVRKPAEIPYYFVNDGSTVKCFSFMDGVPGSSPYNKEKALSDAREFALILKSGMQETRTLIETL